MTLWYNICGGNIIVVISLLSLYESVNTVKWQHSYHSHTKGHGLRTVDVVVLALLEYTTDFGCINEHILRLNAWLLVTERTFGLAKLFGWTSTVWFGPNDRTFFCGTPNFSFKFLFCLMNIIWLHLQPPWVWRGSFLQPGPYLVMKEIVCYLQMLRNYFLSEKIFQK